MTDSFACALENWSFKKSIKEYIAKQLVIFFDYADVRTYALIWKEWKLQSKKIAAFLSESKSETKIISTLAKASSDLQSQKQLRTYTQKVLVFGVILVLIFPHSDWIRTRTTPNTYTFHAVTYEPFFLNLVFFIRVGNKVT